MSPSPLKAVLIGCGNIAGGYDERLQGPQVMTHAKAFSQNAAVKLVGAYDPDAARLSEFARAWNVETTEANPDALLARTRPDLVSICSPNSTHYDVLKTALKFRPRAILCEKPLALNSEQAAEMASDCAKEKVLLAVNYIRRWDPSTLEIGRRIRSGEFGRCQSARVLYTKGVFHNASHAINLMQDWFGEVRGVHRLTRTRTLPDGDLQASFGLSFAGCDDSVFQFHDSRHYNFFEMDFAFEKARVRFPWHGQSIEIARSEPSTLVPGESRLAPVEETLEWTQAFALKSVVNNVVDCLLHSATLRMPPEEAVDTIRICERIRNEVT